MNIAKRYAAEALELVKTRIECDKKTSDSDIDYAAYVYVYYDADADTFFSSEYDGYDDWNLGKLSDFDSSRYADVDLEDDDELAGLAEVWRGWLVDAADKYSENN